MIRAKYLPLFYAGLCLRHSPLEINDDWELNWSIRKGFSAASLIFGRDCNAAHVEKFVAYHGGSMKKCHLLGVGQMHISKSIIHQICRSCPLLEELHISDARCITQKELKRLSSSCPNLYSVGWRHLGVMMMDKDTDDDDDYEEENEEEEEDGEVGRGGSLEEGVQSFLESHPSILQLDLCEFEPDEIYNLIPHLSLCTSIQKLDVSCITGLDTHFLNDTLPHFSLLQDLDLSLCLDMDGSVCQTLRTCCPALTRLILSATPVDHKGVSHLSSLSLTHLDLSQCYQIDDHCVASLASGRVNHTLHHLDLSQTRVTSQGITALFSGNSCPSLRELMLRMTEVSLPCLYQTSPCPGYRLKLLDVKGCRRVQSIDGMLSHIISKMSKSATGTGGKPQQRKHIPSLTSLNLDGSNVEINMKSIAKLLEAFPALQTLSCADCEFQPMSTPLLQSLPRQSIHLTALNLSHCRQLDPHSLWYLSACGCPVLRELNLIGCLLDDLCMRYIAAGCSELVVLKTASPMISDEGVRVISKECVRLRLFVYSRESHITSSSLFSLPLSCQHRFNGWRDEAQHKDEWDREDDDADAEYDDDYGHEMDELGMADFDDMPTEMWMRQLIAINEREKKIFGY